MLNSILTAIAPALNNVYSGWIVWNLFLAFIPLILSFRLFRPQALPQAWFRLSCLLVGLIGVVGLWMKLPESVNSWGSLVGDSFSGDIKTLLRLGWFFLAGGIAFLLGRWGIHLRKSQRAWLWALGVVVFIAFLPNAPYLLTDIIHLIRGISSGRLSTWVVVLVFVPVHLTAILLGFEAYVISLLNLNYYLKRHGAKALVLPMELLIHGLCALGVFLGRFIRLNSWDLVTDPLDVVMITFNTLTSKWPIAMILLTFLIVTVLYWVMKQITLGLKLRLDYSRRGLDPLD
ncbi:MAG: DUF1361 domain-containing protein [Nodosilinea sp.]